MKNHLSKYFILAAVFCLSFSTKASAVELQPKPIPRETPEETPAKAIENPLLETKNFFVDQEKQMKLSKNFSRLTIAASATLTKPADELQLQIGVVTLNEKAQVALEENSLKIQAIAKALEGAGLSRSEYATGSFAIHPTYAPYPQDPSPDWAPSINGYEVKNYILIRTNQLDLAGRLIDGANRAGANSIDHITFGLGDPRSYREDAIKEATKNAIHDAKIMAEAAQMKVGRILSIVLDNAGSSTPYQSPTFFSKALSAAAEPTIEPRSVVITANVTATYEIVPK